MKLRGSLGLEEVTKLASNENPLGCSPKVKAILRELIDETHMYPDASNYELKGCVKC